LVLAPAKERRPGRIDGKEAAIEGRDAEQIFRDLPDAVAFADTLRDLVLEPVVELAQHLLALNARCRLDAGDEHAADPVRRGRVGDRAIADGEAPILAQRAVAADLPEIIDGEEARPLAAQDRFIDRAEFVVDLGPDFMRGGSERVRVLVAEDRYVGVVINSNEFGSPAYRHGKARTKNDLDHLPQRARPALARPE